jgi:outer membrane biosynthesis protein TonB
MGRTARLMISVALAAAGLRGQGPGGSYQGAVVTKAGAIRFPLNSSVTGLVALRVSVDATGVVQGVADSGELPPLTEAAKEGVKVWRFAPAMKAGKPIGGEARVYVVFNPFNPGNVTIPVPPPAVPPLPSGTGDTEVFRPADVQKAIYAAYPTNTVASGTLVLDVKVGADGSMVGATVLGGEAGTPLSGAVTRALRGWKFSGGSYGGKPLVTHVEVAFVFASPALGTR